MSEEKGLIVIEDLTPEKLFSIGGIDETLGKIKASVESIVPDVTTTKGRKEIASLAAKVSSSKVALDNLGKDLVSEWKTKSKAVDDERKKSRLFLDKLRDETRKPLTDWENLEKEKIEKHTTLINNIHESASKNDPMNNRKTTKRLKYDSNWLTLVKPEDSPEEFRSIISSLLDQKIAEMEGFIEESEKADKEKEELDQLRKEKSEREEKERIEREEQERKEYEDRIEKEAEEKAKRDAEEERQRIENEKSAAILRERQANDKAARLEKEAKEKEEKDAIEKKEREEREAKEKKERDERHRVELEEQKVMAQQEERDRVDRKEKDKEAAKQARLADEDHRRSINRSIVSILSSEVKIGEDVAKEVITAIAKGKIPNMRIDY